MILAAGDGAEKGLVFASGMAAITTSILAVVKPGDHIVASPIIYGESFYFLKYELKRWGVETTFIDFNTQDAANYIRPNTTLIYGETIANPLMSVPDMRYLADVAHANGALLFIDNTFATSIIAKPLKFGADLVLYSATKYLGGHDDIVGGAVLGSEKLIKKINFYLGLYGSNLGATESWLLARSLRTLPLRVRKMSENALALAKFFEKHPKVEKVYYPGLDSSPCKDWADSQFEGNGYGGMLCVNFKGGQAEVDRLIKNLQIVRFVPTLAGVGTTLTYPPRASHRDLSPQELAEIGITMGQIRLSAGLRRKDCAVEADLLCRRLGLDTSKKVDQLSFGNRKKVSIVCALQHQPRLCILDEPTSGLDPLMQREFFEILKERNARGATIFLSSHVLSEIQRNCTRAAIIREGKLIACDSVEALSRTSARRVHVQGELTVSTLTEVRDLQQTGSGASFLYGGDIQALLRVLSEQKITDLTISEPDLEEIFLHYYLDGGEET